MFPRGTEIEAWLSICFAMCLRRIETPKIALLLLKAIGTITSWAQTV
jgi:hypothetical protein